MEQRRQQQAKTGKKPGGKGPQSPSASPHDTDQFNFTDPESRIMKTSRGFDQCYNGQASVNDDMVIVGAYSNAHGNDRQEFIPAIESVPDELTGEITTAVADAGYFSEENIIRCQGKNMTPIISTSREKHNSFLSHVLNNDPPDDSGSVPSAERENKQLRSEGEKDIYKRRKQTVEPVFGIIKEIMGFRRFSLRGEAKTDAEWALVCTAYNLKRFFKMQMA